MPPVAWVLKWRDKCTTKNNIALNGSRKIWNDESQWMNGICYRKKHDQATMKLVGCWWRAIASKGNENIALMRSEFFWCETDARQNSPPSRHPESARCRCSRAISSYPSRTIRKNCVSSFRSAATITTAQWTSPATSAAPNSQHTHKTLLRTWKVHYPPVVVCEWDAPTEREWWRL